MRKLVMCVLLVLAMSGCANQPSINLPSSGDIGSSRNLGDTWAFDHQIIDPDPLATLRINDMQIGDIDGDGKLDIWTSGRGGGSSVYQMVWYKNPGWQRFPIAPGDYKYGNLGDLDGDNDLDVVVGNSWFENTGSPQTPDWPEHPLGHSLVPDLNLVGDLNGDQRLDIVHNNKSVLYWMTANGDPKQPWSNYEIYDASGTRTGGDIGDVDGDGDMDVLWGNAWFENPADPTNVPWTRHMIDSNWPA